MVDCKLHKNFFDLHRYVNGFNNNKSRLPRGHCLKLVSHDRADNRSRKTEIDIQVNTAFGKALKKTLCAKELASQFKKTKLIKHFSIRTSVVRY